MATDGVNGAPTGKPDDFVEKTVEFPDGSIFERIRPLTDLRKDPGEGRIIYVCKRTAGKPRPDEVINQDHSGELVMKIKAQWPGPQNLIHEGPSPHTKEELKALQIFTDAKVDNVPHLINWKKAIQPHDGIHPGGYIIYTIMTKMPGQTLWDMPFWSQTDEEREEIKAAFLIKLKELRKLGIAPFDCALRNILWDKEKKIASIIDFEHYEESTDPIENEMTELQRWGVERRPPPRTWFQEWGLKGY